MGHITCFTVVSAITDEVTRQYGNLIQENDLWKQKLKQYCEIIDGLAERFEGKSYEVEVDEHTFDIMINFVCGEMLIESDSDEFDEFYKLIQHTNKVSFQRDSDETIQICFKFDGIWVERR